MASRSLQRRQLSRSKIDLFVECPRCFWLDVAQGVRRPSGPPFTLNNAVDALLEARYGITSRDVDTEPIAKAQDDGWTPEDCVRWLSEKYDLEPLNQLMEEP